MCAVRKRKEKSCRCVRGELGGASRRKKERERERGTGRTPRNAQDCTQSGKVKRCSSCISNSLTALRFPMSASPQKRAERRGTHSAGRRLNLRRVASLPPLTSSSHPPSSSRLMILCTRSRWRTFHFLVVEAECEVEQRGERRRRVADPASK